MNEIINLLRAFLLALTGSNIGILNAEGDQRVFQATKTFTGASETGSAAIQLPSNQDRGWIVLGMYCEPTTTDFTVDVERSGKRGGKLTDGAVYSTFALPKRSTLEKTVLGPFTADDKETFTFNLTNGATASNVVRVAVLAMRR